MNEEAITTIMQFVNEQLFEPRMSWPKIEFMRRSYSRWAAYEMLELLMDRPFDDTEMLIEAFIMKMTYCSHIAENADKPNFVFATAIDVAEDILFLCRR